MNVVHEIELQVSSAKVIPRLIGKFLLNSPT